MTNVAVRQHFQEAGKWVVPSRNNGIGPLIEFSIQVEQAEKYEDDSWKLTHDNTLKKTSACDLVHACIVGDTSNMKDPNHHKESLYYWVFKTH